MVRVALYVLVPLLIALVLILLFSAIVQCYLARQLARSRDEEQEMAGRLATEKQELVEATRALQQARRQMRRKKEELREELGTDDKTRSLTRRGSTLRAHKLEAKFGAGLVRSQSGRNMCRRPSVQETVAEELDQEELATTPSMANPTGGAAGVGVAPRPASPETMARVRSGKDDGKSVRLSGIKAGAGSTELESVHLTVDDVEIQATNKQQVWQAQSRWLDGTAAEKPNLAI